MGTGWRTEPAAPPSGRTVPSARFAIDVGYRDDRTITTGPQEETTLLEVRESPLGGRGLFATKRIRADVLLMSAPVLLIAPEERGPLEETIVDSYVYEWDDDGTAALVLGVSSMCNHATDPNAYLWLVPDQQTAELWSTRVIAPDEEITVSYRASGDPDAPLWFDVVEPG